MALRNKGCGPVGPLAKPPVPLLLCFAVKQEMQFLPHPSPQAGRIQVWITGIGRKNAADNIRQALDSLRPQRVISAGFAGGLNPALKLASVVYDEDFDAGFGRTLEDLGAVPARFYSHPRVVITAAEKRLLWQDTGADAVEMESSVIRAICRELKVPSATVRVISDDAARDLPLDFNSLMTSEDRISLLKLLWAVFCRPGRIPKLLAFRRQTLLAARSLGAVLDLLLRAQRG
jgi:adenosylhomocysteine nucleosidase